MLALPNGSRSGGVPAGKQQGDEDDVNWRNWSQRSGVSNALDLVSGCSGTMRAGTRAEHSFDGVVHRRFDVVHELGDVIHRHFDVVIRVG